MTMATPDDSLIEYPCYFPVKAMGLAEHDIEAIFMEIARVHFPHQEKFDIKRMESKGGKYLSITITLNAHNREQLDATYQALFDHEKILMTL